jgi:hypothetical protein
MALAAVARPPQRIEFRRIARESEGRLKDGGRKNSVFFIFIFV